MNRSLLRVPAAIVLAASLVIVAPALTGCSLIKGAVENATGGQVDLGGASVPADFPSTVPLIDGDVINGSSITGDNGQVWNVLIKVHDESAFDTIASQMAAAGFESGDVGGGTEKGGTASYTDGTYQVLVAVGGGDSPEGWIANYTVSDSANE